jgi:cellulose biosynthesis protein BcsQ
MTTPVVAFLNNNGGVGTTSLAYHLAWMYADLGRTVLAADLDPQANLTAAFLDDDRLESLWPDDAPHVDTIHGAMNPLLRGVGDVLATPHAEAVADRLFLVPGDLALSEFEDELSQQWPACMDGKERGFRVLSAFWRVLQRAGEQAGADVLLVDLGANLGAINRAALIAADYLVVPLAPDLFSLQGLRNLGPALRRWRGEWRERLKRNPAPSLALPPGGMQPVGYIILQHAVRLSQSVRAYERWVQRIPAVYSQSVLEETGATADAAPNDPNCLGMLKHYRSLMPLAQEARKPMFHLKPADGAMGAHLAAMNDARKDFEALARAIAVRCGLGEVGSAAS